MGRRGISRLISWVAVLVRRTLLKTKTKVHICVLLFSFKITMRTHTSSILNGRSIASSQTNVNYKLIFLNREFIRINWFSYRSYNCHDSNITAREPKNSWISKVDAIRMCMGGGNNAHFIRSHFEDSDSVQVRKRIPFALAKFSSDRGHCLLVLFYFPRRTV